MGGFIAQLVEQRTGNAEVTGSNPVEALNFFQASSFQLLKLENLLRWSFFTLIYNRSSKMNYFIYFTSLIYTVCFIIVETVYLNFLKLFCLVVAAASLFPKFIITKRLPQWRNDRSKNLTKILLKSSSHGNQTIAMRELAIIVWGLNLAEKRTVFKWTMDFGILSLLLPI